MASKLKTSEKTKNNSYLDKVYKLLHIILIVVMIISFLNPSLIPYGILFGIVIVLVVMYSEDRNKMMKEINNIKDDIQLLHSMTKKSKKGTISLIEILLFCLIVLFLIWFFTQVR